MVVAVGCIFNSHTMGNYVFLRMANTVRPFVGSPTQKQVGVASGTGRPPAGRRTLTVCVHSLPCECVPDFSTIVFF